MELHYEGPCYSNVDLIKKALVAANRPLSLDDIVDFLQTHWGGTGTSLDSAKTMAHVALNAPAGRFVQSHGELWAYKSETYDTWQRSIRDQAFRLLQSKNVPCTERDLVNYIYGVKGYAKNRVTRELRTLSTDVRFVVIDGRYLLSKWELLNDKVYTYMVERTILTARPSEIEAVVRAHNSIQDSNVVFAPTVDRRFLPKSDGEISLANAQTLVGSVNEVRMRFVGDIIHSKMRFVLDYIEENSNGNGASAMNIMEHVFKTTSEQRSYKLWTELLTNSLNENPDAKCVDGLWYPSSKQRDLGPISVRSVQEESGPTLEKSHDGETNNQSAIIPKHTGYRISVTPSNENLVQGELQLVWWHISVLRFSGLQNRTAITVHTLDGLIYECWYEPSIKRVNGLQELYRENDVTTKTTVLVWKTNHKDHIFLEIEGASKTSSARQPLESQNNTVFQETGTNLDFEASDVFSFICKILISDNGRAGLSTEQIRSAVGPTLPSLEDNKIMAVLENNMCFYSLNDRWFIVPSKISRYYIDHRGEEVESQAYFRYRDNDLEDKPSQADAEPDGSEDHSIEAVKRSLIELGKERGALSYEEIDEALRHLEANFDSLNAVYDQISAAGIDLINEAGILGDIPLISPIGTKTGETTRVVHIVANEEINEPPVTEEVGVNRSKDIGEGHFGERESDDLDGLVHDLQTMKEKFIEERSRIEQYLSSYEEQLTTVINRAQLLRDTRHD